MPLQHQPRKFPQIAHLVRNLFQVSIAVKKIRFNVVFLWGRVVMFQVVSYMNTVRRVSIEADTKVLEKRGAVLKPVVIGRY